MRFFLIEFGRATSPFPRTRGRSAGPLLLTRVVWRARLAGRDRTGVLSGLLETLAGYDAETVRTDFLLSRIGTEVAREHLLAFAKKHSMSAEDDDDGSASFDEVPGFFNLVSLKGTCWDAFVEAVGKKFGGFEGYATKVLGFSKDDLVIIKRNLNEAPEQLEL